MSKLNCAIGSVMIFRVGRPMIVRLVIVMVMNVGVGVNQTRMLEKRM